MPQNVRLNLNLVLQDLIDLYEAIRILSDPCSNPKKGVILTYNLSKLFCYYFDTLCIYSINLERGI